MTITITRIISTDQGNFIELEAELRSGAESERRAFKILPEQYSSLRPQKGEITEYQFERLEEAHLICTAYTRAANILSFGANTARTLKMKLRRRGFSDSIADAAVEMLISKGYITEDEDIKRDIERCLAKGWGSRRIIAYLHQKGYDDEALWNAENSLSEVDFVRACADIIDKKYGEIPVEPHERKKMFDALVRYGYLVGEITGAINILKSERSGKE